MFGPLTRAQMRDQVRRNLNQIPPIDDGTGVEGAEPTRWPWPKNPLVDKKIDEAVAFFSRKCNIAGDALPRTIPIPAQSNLGPFAIRLDRIAPAGTVSDVRHCSYSRDGTNLTPLTSTSRAELDRDRVPWEATTPGNPQKFMVDAGSLIIWPAPNCSSYLIVEFGRPVWEEAATTPGADGEMLTAIPSDYLPLVLAEATRLVCVTQVGDQVLAQIAQACAALVQDGLPDMRAFFARRNRLHRPRMVGDVGRIPIGRGNR